MHSGDFLPTLKNPHGDNMMSTLVLTFSFSPGLQKTMKNSMASAIR